MAGRSIRQGFLPGQTSGRLVAKAGAVCYCTVTRDGGLHGLSHDSRHNWGLVGVSKGLLSGCEGVCFGEGDEGVYSVQGGLSQAAAACYVAGVRGQVYVGSR